MLVDQSDLLRSHVSLWTENLGSDQLRVRLPADSVLRQTIVDGEEVTAAADAKGWLQIPLPIAQRFPLVQLHYDQALARRAWTQPVPFFLPDVAAAVIQQQWHLWTPPDFGMAINGVRGPAGTTPASLLQPRFRPPQRRPFNLFALNDWQNLLRRLATSDNQMTPLQMHVLETLGQPEQLTVGSWIAALPTRNVQIDPIRLAELGVQPQTALPATQAPDDLRRGVDRLQQLHLSLLDVEGQLTVTTESVSAELPAAVVCDTAGNVAKLSGPAVAAWHNTDRDPVRAPSRLGPAMAGVGGDLARRIDRPRSVHRRRMATPSHSHSDGSARHRVSQASNAGPGPYRLVGRTGIHLVVGPPSAAACLVVALRLPDGDPPISPSV